jgi:hypothetical protein
MEFRGHGAIPFFIVPARSRKHLDAKIAELTKMNVPFIVICGEKVDHPNVVFHENAGKWDAINFAVSFLPEEANVIVLNDVDTEIHGFENALSDLNSEADLVYCRVQVSTGPQVKFYRLLNPLRSRFHVAASGELMAMNKEVFKEVLPLPPCLAEDSFILFKTLELGYKANFCTSAYVTTERTQNAKDEEAYKNRTTLGIYQALDYTKPPIVIKVFYVVLPLLAPLLSLMGKDGRAWTKGINRALKDHVKKRNLSKF